MHVDDQVHKLDNLTRGRGKRKLRWITLIKKDTSECGLIKDLVFHIKHGILSFFSFLFFSFSI